MIADCAVVLTEKREHKSLVRVNDLEACEAERECDDSDYPDRQKNKYTGNT